MSTSQNRNLSPRLRREGLRPYRSHKFPACDFCRKRKSRCVRSLENPECLLCQMHEVPCTQEGTFSTLEEGHSNRREQTFPLPRNEATSSCETQIHSSVRTASESNTDNVLPRDDSNIRETVDVLQDTSHDPGGTLTTRSVETQSGHIVGPVVAHDVQVLDLYMSPSATTTQQARRVHPYSLYSDDPQNPILYLRVPRRREHPASGNGATGFAQWEAIFNIIEPHCSKVFDLYFSEFHPALPFLDEQEVVDAYRRAELPYPLLCEIFAASMIFWDKSAEHSMASRPRPDLRYIWRQTVKALDEDFTAPGFATILACVLDLSGRPTTLVTYNALNIGRLVALSHGLGLNRSPCKWRLDERKKALRIRTWWAVLIHDWWASLTTGTPPHVTLANFDVELPDLSLLGVTANTHTGQPETVRQAGAYSFLHLCRLTNILGSILPLIYGLKPAAPTSDPQKALRRVITLLDEWEDLIPEWLEHGSDQFQRHAPGALNLRLCFLATKMCLSRLLFLKAVHSQNATDQERKLYLQSRCRKSAAAVVEFVMTLEGDDLGVFWLPYTAYHFSSATTLLLGCALEAPNDEIAQDCVARAQGMVRHLRKIKSDTDWDLADVCLAQCETITHRMGDGTYLEFRRQRATGRFSSQSTNAGKGSDLASSSGTAFARTQKPTHSAHGGESPIPESSSGAQVQMDHGTDGQLDALKGNYFDFGSHEVSGLYGMTPILDSQWSDLGYLPDSYMWNYSGLDEHGDF